MQHRTFRSIFRGQIKCRDFNILNFILAFFFYLATAVKYCISRIQRRRAGIFKTLAGLKFRNFSFKPRRIIAVTIAAVIGNIPVLPYQMNFLFRVVFNTKINSPTNSAPPDFLLTTPDTAETIIPSVWRIKNHSR